MKEEEKRKEIEVLKDFYHKKVEETNKKGTVDSSVVVGLEKQKA